MRSAVKLVVAVLLGTAVLLSSGCGGGTSSAPSGSSAAPVPNGTQMLVNMGDAPVDQVVDFEVTVTSVVLTDAGGGTVSVLSSPPGSS